MPELPFYIVDVFAEEKYSGNQLAVVRDGNNSPPLRCRRLLRRCTLERKSSTN